MPATLNTYLRQVQRFCRDGKQELLNPEDLISYINQARREVAMRAQCVRVFPPISGAIVSCAVDTGGSGYTSPTVDISPPDSPSGFLPYAQGNQATATATEVAGVITAVNITYGGAGYFAPVVTISDPTGTGASITPTTSYVLTLNQGQEKYDFSSVDLSMFPGVESIYFVRSVSIIYSNYRYSLPMYAFSTYQAMIRQYVANQFQYVPTFGSQFGQGVNGSLFLYPPPSQTYQMEWDCQCLPCDLNSDGCYEAIPDPWTDLVPYFATYLAFAELQNINTARFYAEEFERRIHNFGAYTRPGRVSNPYGRY